jgi:geranylgeranyl diphosphate synthase type I
LERCIRSGATFSPQLSDLLDYHFGYGAHGPARRGKRLRPTMIVRIAADEGAPSEDAMDAAAAIEILHNYSLVHDDIEDRDELRHGRRTLWSLYGVAQAINAGDAMCALSFLALARARHPAERVLEMVRVLHEAHATMCDGQALDLQFESAARVDLEAYRAMIAGKTSSLFGAACELGALCAGLDAERVGQYRELGRAYGLGFQIRDDVQGVWGQADLTGKVAANDVARRKWTFPVVWALDGAPSEARTRVAEAYALGRPLESAEVERVVDALGILGAREAADRAAAEHLAVIERYAKAGVRAFMFNEEEPA